MKAIATKKRDPELVAGVDQDAALARVREIEGDLAATREEAGEEVSVSDDEDYLVACALLLRVVEKRKYCEEERKAFRADVQKLLDRVDGWFERSLTDAAALEAQFRGAVADYAMRLSAKQHGLRVAASKLPPKDEERAHAMMAEANDVKAPKVPGIAITPKARLVITNEKLVPAAYWKKVIDAKLLEAAIAGGQKVPGAHVDVEMSVRVTPAHAKGGAL